MSGVDIASLVVSLISLVVAFCIGRMQINQSNRISEFEKRQDARDEARHADAVYAEATRFIQKYNQGDHNAEIFLLPLCVAAYRYNPAHPYRREIYREFCGLREDIQHAILTRCHIDIPCHRDDDYFHICLKKLLIEIKEYCSDGEHLFNDDGKYLEGALSNHGRKAIPNIRCAIDSWQQEVLKQPLMKNSKSVSHNDMDYKKHVTNLLAHEAGQQPISRLAEEETSLGIPIMDSDEILISYLCCLIAEYVPSYLYKCQKTYDGTGNPEDYLGTRYMEDAFLMALHSITIYGYWEDCQKSKSQED